MRFLFKNLMLNYSNLLYLIQLFRKMSGPPNNTSIVYRRTRVKMPALSEEIDDALEERIMFRYHTNPTQIFANNGKAVGMLCVQMEMKEADASKECPCHYIHMTLE